jgi:hypothetical protein
MSRATRGHQYRVLLDDADDQNHPYHRDDAELGVRGWTVCRFHGARGGAPKGMANGAYKHGLHTKEAVNERRLVSDLLRQSRKAIGSLPFE